MTIAKLKAKSHILSLLGDELIGSDALAIFELVKNSYDADSSQVDIIFSGLDSENQQKLVIKDNGYGMDKEVIENVWLTLGTDFKRGLNRKVSKKGRVSLGNKGVGRLAVHKIASNIELKTKIKNSETACKISFNWQELIDSKDYIEDIEIELNTYIPDDNEFPNNQGTEIILTGFKDKKWNKTKVRDFYRKINSIKSPFKKIHANDDESKKGKDQFNISIDLDGKNSWIANVHKPEEILEKAVFKYNFTIDISSNTGGDDANISWEYCFNEEDISGDDFKRKIISKDNDVLDVSNLLNEYYDGCADDKKRHLINIDLEGIGKIQGEFYVYNLDKNIINLFFQNEKGGIKDFIKNHCGVSIYRDSVRVFNYGETDDDWLGLDLAKIQRSGDHFARKVTIGAINLSLKSNNDTLVEKTNREGFINNDYFKILKVIIQKTFNKFERQARDDKELIQEYINGFKTVKKAGLSETIIDLKKQLAVKGLETEFQPLIGRIEKDYNTMRDVMVNSGMSGLNLSIIFHEVDRELRHIDRKLEISATESEIADVKIKVKSLVSILDTFTPMLRNTVDKKVNVFNSIKRLKQINQGRFDYHKVIFSSPILTEEVDSFEYTGKSNLIFTSMNNIIDNSIYWLGYNHEEVSRGLYITTDLDNFNGNAVLIADNGPGFKLDSDMVTQPFVTSKEGGMGIGLYLANLVFESMGGQFLIVDACEYDIPDIYHNGACIALVFPRK